MAEPKKDPVFSRHSEMYGAAQKRSYALRCK